MPAFLTPQVFTILAALIEERVGIHYGAADAPVLAEKIAGRMSEAGFESALDYYYYLRYDASGAAEMDLLVDSLVVGETYFFRERAPLDIAIEHIVRPAIDKKGRARVWCAAAATGEEPLTFAMLLSHAGLLGSTTLVASDISGRALARAKEGVYGARSIRALPTDAARAVADRWLTPSGPGVRANRSLIDAIQWRRQNLVDDLTALGTFDLILCRNVLIYFSDATVRTVIGKLHDRLEPGGRVLVGLSESLLRFGTMLVCEEHRGAFFYRRTEG